MEILPLYCDLTGQKLNGTIESFEIERDRVSIRTEIGWGEDYEYYSIPLYYLYDDTWIEEVKEKMRIKKEKEFVEKQRRELKRKQHEEERERKLYEKLKKKYEGCN